MLDLELDMEADLGIDTVKQAETFSAIRQAFDIPRRDDIKLRDYPTLASVIQFVLSNRPDLAGDQRPESRDQVTGQGTMAAPTSVAAPGPISDLRSQVTDKVLTMVAEKTGYPRTCWIWSSTWRPTWALTRSSRPRPSPPSVRPSTSRGAMTSSCATTPRWRV